MSFDLQSFHSLYMLSNTSLVDQCIALLTNQWGGSYDSRLHYLLDNNKLKYDSIRNNGLIHDDSIDHHNRYHHHDHDHDHHISSCSWILFDHKSNLVIGHVRMSPMRQNTSNDLTGSALSCILTSIVIHSEYRSQGIGRYLMNRIEQIAITAGYYHIYLWTTDATDFYRKLHYHVCDNYGLSSNVSVFDYISTKRLNSIESLLLKRLSTIHHNNDSSSESYNNAIDHNNSVGAVTYDNDSQHHSGKSIVWLRKRIKDMCPFIFIPEITLKTYITDNFHKQYHHHHLGHQQQHHQRDDDIYHSSLQSSYSSSSNAFIHMINDPQQGRFGIHWSQQVGPSCGIQAIRFAIDILLPSPSQSYSSTELKVEQPDMLPSFQLIHDNNHESLEINNNKNKNKATTCSDQCGPQFTISIPSSSLSSSAAVAVADSSLPSSPSASTTFVNEQEMSHNFLQEAIRLEYTTEGAIYYLHHIVDLIQRYSCSSSTSSSRSTSPSHNHSHGHGDGHDGNGVDRIKAKMMSVKESIKRPRDLCDLLMCHNSNSYKGYNDLRYPRKVMATNILDSTAHHHHNYPQHHHHPPQHHHHPPQHHHNYPQHRGVLIFPYDRDECMSEPCNKGGSKAHYALIIGYIIINNEEKMMKKEEMMKGEKQYGSSTVDCSSTKVTTTTTLDPSVNYAMVNSDDYDENSKSSYSNNLDITAACNDDDNDNNSDDSVAINDLDIDDDIYLIGIHGLSRHPIVAPYRKWIASNQQLNDISYLSTTGVSYMVNNKYNNSIYSDNLNKHSNNNLAGNFVYVSVGT